MHGRNVPDICKGCSLQANIAQMGYIFYRMTVQMSTIWFLMNRVLSVY